jgi:elongin-A
MAGAFLRKFLRLIHSTRYLRLSQFLRDVETKRLDELRNRIRTKRLKAECEKKEREIKLTDNILPIKRSRNKCMSNHHNVQLVGLLLTSVPGSANPQSKTLFQKTRSEASKFQKSIFSLQMVPRMPDGKSYRVLHNSLSAKLPPALPSTSPSCVTVTRTQCPKPSLPSVSATLPSDSQPTSPTDDAITDQPQTNLLPNGRPPNTGKKDPMASLFIPKHRAHSQLPSTPSRSSRTTAPLTSRTRILS